jgi:hypothetical protein
MHDLPIQDFLLELLHVWIVMCVGLQIIW